MDEFRSEVNKIFKQQQHLNNQCNLNPSQCRALTQLKQDISRVVLTVDKGVAMVIMDQEDYTNKALSLLQDTNTYKVLPKDPTSQLKNKLISLLKDIKHAGGLNTTKYKQLYPTSAVPPISMAYPKSIKQVHPLGPLFPVGVHHLWHCQGACTYHQTPSRPIPTPPQKYTTHHPAAPSSSLSLVEVHW